MCFSSLPPPLVFGAQKSPGVTEVIGIPNLAFIPLGSKQPLRSDGGLGTVPQLGPADDPHSSRGLRKTEDVCEAREWMNVVMFKDP